MDRRSTAPSRCILFFVVFVMAATACSPASPSAAEPTVTPADTAIPPKVTTVPTNTTTPTITPTHTLTKTPLPTDTPTVTATPLQPREMTQTVVAERQQATQQYSQWIHDVHRNCKAIDWVELSEVEYAKSHENECVYIPGRASDLNFSEDLISIWIGSYSANIPVGIGPLEQNGRIAEDDWVNVYGYVCAESCWTTTNRLDGTTKPIAGVRAILAETSHGSVWYDPDRPTPPDTALRPGTIIQHADGRLFQLQDDGTWIEVPLFVGLQADGTCPAGFHRRSGTSGGPGQACERDSY